MTPLFQPNYSRAVARAATVTGLKGGSPRVCGSITERGKVFISILHGSDCSRTLPSLLFLGGRWNYLSTSKADQSLLFSPEVKNELSLTSTPLYTLITFITDNSPFLVKVSTVRVMSTCSIFFNPDQASLIAVIKITNSADHGLVLLTL